MSSILIKGGTVVNEGSAVKMDLLISDSVIQEIGTSLKGITGSEIVIDAEGCIVLPGIIDDQVHFRQPGLEQKGTIASESRAAVAGGVTTFMEMPNTIPPATTLQLLKDKERIADAESWANYSFYLGATNSNIEEIRKIDPTHVCGVKVFMGSSTGNLLVDDENALNGIFLNSLVPVAVHSEDEDTIQKNLHHFRKKYGDSVAASLHPEIRSREACILCTQRAINHCETTGGHLHLLHISTAEEVQMVREAKKQGLAITAEVCVHHLFFSDEDYLSKGNLIKWNPAIKSKSDRDALVKGLLDRTIDIVATDHAPHELDKKLDSYFNAPSGGPMVEHSLVAMLELSGRGLFSLYDVVDWMAHKPASLFRIDRRGFLRKGYFADITVVKNGDPWKVRGEDTCYKVKWSPLEGEIFHNRIITTIVNGEIVYNQGVFYEENRKPMALRFNR